jgi:predicted aminopeptidase
MIFLIAVAALVVGGGVAYVASEDVRYLARAGIEETRILSAARPISRIVEDPDTPAGLRGTLQLVLDARDFAAGIGFEAEETYTTYTDVGRDTLLLVLQAAPKDCICPVTWKWPIVGRMPYKGYFDAEAGRRAAAELTRSRTIHSMSAAQHRSTKALRKWRVIARRKPSSAHVATRSWRRARRTGSTTSACSGHTTPR